jgi:transducin (beta)-like 1
MCVWSSVRTNRAASDYRETAARLQKEWNVQDPQQLPFAPHVTHHALVAVLNRGLLYNLQERDLEQVREG